MDKFLSKHLTEKQKQWAWFIILWIVGFSAVGILAYAIRTLMGIE